MHGMVATSRSAFEEERASGAIMRRVQATAQGCGKDLACIERKLGKASESPPPPPPTPQTGRRQWQGTQRPSRAWLSEPLQGTSALGTKCGTRAHFNFQENKQSLKNSETKPGLARHWEPLPLLGTGPFGPRTKWVLV